MRIQWMGTPATWILIKVPVAYEIIFNCTLFRLPFSTHSKSGCFVLNLCRGVVRKLNKIRKIYSTSNGLEGTSKGSYVFASHCHTHSFASRSPPPPPNAIRGKVISKDLWGSYLASFLLFFILLARCDFGKEFSLNYYVVQYRAQESPFLLHSALSGFVSYTHSRLII